MRLYIQHLLRALIDEVAFYKPQEKVYISFNKYNHSLYEWFVRKSEGRSSSIGKQWPEVFAAFKPRGVRKINHVDQYVCETTLADLKEAFK
jgi:short subunit dehydrogenase-like uncharacterized protein